MVRPAVLVALILLIAPAIILTVGRSLHASGANTITVNTLLDSSVASDGVCSLREAINNANAKSDTTGGDCAPGTGNDTIAFTVSGTIAVASTLPAIANTVEIDGTGQTIVIDGGGANSILVNSGVLTLNNLTISNAATTGNGGGVQNNGNLTVTNSTFLGNSANSGGAIFNSDSGVLSVTNCTFSGNIGTSGGGGAIFTNNGGTVVSSTFSANSSVLVVNTGAAIFGNGSTITVSNSILANSIGFNCPVGQAVEVIGNGGGNISDDSSCGFGSSTGANGKTIGDSVLPLLDPSGLQNNGGPTDTIALQPDSPAVNAVPIANCLPTDRRGDPRPDPADNSGACDAGAFESIDVTATPTATATATATPAATASPTASATATGTPTATATASATDTPTVTSTPTDTATGSGTATATATSTATPTITATATPTVTATPTDTASATATITITPSPSPTPKPAPVKLTISPTLLNFGNVKTGAAPIKSVTLHNKSKTIDTIIVSQVTGQFFSLASNTCDAGVPPGGTCKLGVSFAPLAAGKKFNGSLTFNDQSKKSGHKISLKGKGVSTPTPKATPTPSVTATATETATATPTVTSTGGATPTATATVTSTPTVTSTGGATPTATTTRTATATATTLGTPTPTSTSTATYTLANISETVSGFVDLSNPNAAPNPVQTMQAIAVSTPSFSDSISVSDTNVSVSGSASASQISQAGGSTISATESAAAAADLSLCVGPSFLCTAENQGITELNAEFCITATTTYSLTGSVQASANQDLGNISAVGIVSIETVGPSPMFLVNEQATNGQNVPISMSLPLTAGCYDMVVEVFADALPSGTGAGNASASCNVVLSPQ